MKIDWTPQKGDLVSFPDRIVYNKSRKYAIVVDVSPSGNLIEVLVDDCFMFANKAEVLPIVDLEGRWIQLGR